MQSKDNKIYLSKHFDILATFPVFLYFVLMRKQKWIKIA